MKKIFFLSILIIIIIISIDIVTFSDNPYIGQYVSPNNTILKLDSNNNCTIINNLYKDSFYTKGKYVIENNNINITFDNNEPNYYGASSLKGNFEGSRIKLYNSVERKYSIFLRE